MHVYKKPGKRKHVKKITMIISGITDNVLFLVFYTFSTMNMHYFYK